MANDNSNFEGLVSTMSDEEKKIMLNKIQKDNTQDDSYSKIGGETIFTIAPTINDKIKELTLFQRFWFWLKALFTSSTVADVYNNYLVGRIAASIEREYKGLINHHRQILNSRFYEKLVLLKNASEFFEKSIYDYEQYPDLFYTYLAEKIIPDVMEEIRKECDPHQYPYTKEITNEMRTNLIRKMERAEDSISQDKRAQMYAAVKSIEWLRAFVKLPFIRFVSKFVMNNNGLHECQYNQCQTELSNFAKVFVHVEPITEDVLLALDGFEKSLKTSNTFVPEELADAPLSNFVENASAQISVIGSFAEEVPVEAICAVVMNNSVYTSERVGGGEDWFVKFKAQQKVSFDRRWEAWLHEYKKEKIKIKMASYFGITSFVHFPYRPWKEIWGGIPFKYELTMGFLYNFFRTIFPQYESVLKIISLEGDFSIKDNRIEFTDTTASLLQLSQDMNILVGQLTAAGEFGQSFAKYQGVHTRSKTSEERVKVLMDEVEHAAKNIVLGFGTVCRSMENLLNAILSIKVTAYYGPLTNLSKIQGAENRNFRENLLKTKDGIFHAYEILQDLEPLDAEEM